MFKKIASEALGLSDIGSIIQPKDFGSVDADDYLFHEDGEKIFFLIKSKKDEYCFTNLALIHVDGDSAVSSKRSIKRYEYATEDIDHVTLETAGTLDMDVELKFVIGGVAFSIDVRKVFIEQLKDIYKALISIGKRQRADAICRDNALRTLDATASMYKITTAASGEAITAQYNEILKNLNSVMLVGYTKRDFSDVFTKYIHA
ncbi:PH domain-containing protein [Hydrogenophaga pseudoflava]|uniref:PH domain-containing protein n=1 Tax=Hydrogenophaga pseudoflava TaxID=47421 RepID=UPI0027E54EBD|nr:PH domain-containing protein [Hydrogenophaga pseudoflava]MDQ7744734.1 PH domain-containing protein [Hydrogenophaga pseudoflava]